jgi:hypothetical protein
MNRIQPLSLAVFALAFLVAVSPQAFAETPAARGAIEFFEGEVKVDGVAAEIGAKLGAVTRIETGSASSCEIVFDKKNVIRVGQNSVAVLDFSGIRKEVTLKKGGLTSVLRNLGKSSAKDTFRVVTDTAVAGVRGTSFCVWADADSSYICACNGTVRTIDAKGGHEQILSAAHHSARQYTRKGGVISFSQAGLEHHSDASVESLAARIGEKVDWNAIEGQAGLQY